MPAQYKVSGFSNSPKTRTFSSYESADRATRPNIVQKVMVMLSKKKKRFGGAIAHAANTKNEQIKAIDRELARQSKR